MKTLLVVDSSPLTQGSKSRELTQLFTQQWAKKYPADKIIERHVGHHPLPHLDEATIHAFFTPPEARTAEQREAVALSDELIDELESTDVLVIGSPMHNFSITSTLKAWIDHIVRAGRTFNYTEQGPQGLLTEKTVYILAARGGNYAAGSPMQQLNHQDTYLKTILGFIGLTNVQTISAEGVSMGNEGFEHAKQMVMETV